MRLHEAVIEPPCMTGLSLKTKLLVPLLPSIQVQLGIQMTYSNSVTN